VTGWLVLLALGATAMGTAVLLGLPRRFWSLTGAALMLAGAGYSLQGRPGLPSAAPVRVDVAAADDSGLAVLRERMWGRFTADGDYLVAADALARTGAHRAAALIALRGIRQAPDSAQLWTGLGTALAENDRTLSPPARFAFAQARRLAPRHPGPPFFAGLAAVRAEDLEEARRQWRTALALTPPGASYRSEIAGRLALLERLMDGTVPPQR
jgi:Flp pilus assembly protein TadD